FMDAARNGDLAALTEVLSEDVVAYTDGGGKVRAALRPVVGRDKVVAFVVGLVSRYPVGDVHPVTVNGEPAAWMVLRGAPQLLAVASGTVASTRCSACSTPTSWHMSVRSGRRRAVGGAGEARGPRHRSTPPCPSPPGARPACPAR